MRSLLRAARVMVLLSGVACLVLFLSSFALAQDAAGAGTGEKAFEWKGWMILLIAVAAILLLVLIIVLMKYFNLWIQCYMTKTKIGFLDLIGMTLRKVNATVIVRSQIMVGKAGLTIDTGLLEAHYLAGGNVWNVSRSLIAANRAGIPLDFKRATAIDLAGRDVLEAVSMSVSPRVIDCPDPTKGRSTIDAVAMDGIQLKAKARVTVRTNIDRLVGGATAETIIARVGEGIVTTIGSATSFKKVLESPDLISQTVLKKGLDAGTAYEILSIDIADVDVGDNVGARLQAEQAAADLRVAQAKAEERRAMAAAREAEMKALTQENRAKVVLAEAEIPQAIAFAFREGRLGIMDYYALRNIQADTTMRESIGGTGSSGGSTGTVGGEHKGEQKK